jgi:hypothetical protein
MSNTYRRIVLASRSTGRHHAMWSIAGKYGSHGVTGGQALIAQALDQAC